MKTICLTLVLLLPTTAFAQSTYGGAPCAPDDNECLLRSLLFQTRELAQERLKTGHLQSALEAKTAESQALQSALTKEQQEATKSAGHPGMWVSVGALGGIVLTTIIVFAVGRATPK